MTLDLLRRVFGVEVHVVPGPRTGAPYCIPFDLTGVGGLADTEHQNEAVSTVSNG